MKLPHTTSPRCAGRHSWTPGFSLIEILVVIAIIGILAVLMIPRMQDFIINGKLEAAKPYMMAIAAKVRARHNEFGNWFSYADPANHPEQELEDNLGVDLKSAADFCFLVLDCSATPSDCVSTNINKVPDFEVWAVLSDHAAHRPGNAAVTLTTNQGPACTLAEDKDASGGWVAANQLTGQILVLRSPPFADGIDSGDWDWVAGFSSSDVFD